MKCLAGYRRTIAWSWGTRKKKKQGVGPCQLAGRLFISSFRQQQQCSKSWHESGLWLCLFFMEEEEEYIQMGCQLCVQQFGKRHIKENCKMQPVANRQLQNCAIGILVGGGHVEKKKITFPRGCLSVVCRVDENIIFVFCKILFLQFSHQSRV